MFIGREQELQQLANAFALQSAAVLLYGKRRVGKTTLIKQALFQQTKPIVYYECIKGTMKDNISGFTQELVRLNILPVMVEFASFQDVFTYLDDRGENCIIVIDEYPYLKSMTPGAAVDSAFQSIIDNHLSHIDLVLSGSHIGMMKEMLAEGNALYGRFGTVIRLRELSYRTADAFYSDKAPYDKLGFYSVFGGSPYVLQQLQPHEDLRNNIIATVLNENSPVYLYAAHLLLSDYSNSMNAERIFAALGNGNKRYSELEHQLDANKTGNLAKQLKSLTALELIQRTAPINKIGDTKKASYSINDNLLRFYFTYVYRNKGALQMLGPEAFYDAYVAPTITGFISHRFEDICRDFFSLQAKSGKLPGVRNIGSYYYDDPATKTNGEFDVALETEGGYTIFEVKYYHKPMSLGEMHQEIQQIRAIRELSVVGIGFVCTGGFTEKEAGIQYYTAEDLFA